MSGANKRIVILGAASAIAEATARIWAAQGARMLLVGRDAQRLEAIAAHLKTLGAADARVVALDCARADARVELAAMVQSLGGLDILLLAYGALGDQIKMETDPAAVAALIQTNFASAAAWCLAAGEILARQRSGVLLVLGSVAGDLALTFGAWEGVYVTGGLVRPLLPWIEAGGFRRRFEDKGRLASVVARVPTSIVLHADPGLLGAAASAMLAAPQTP